MGLKIDLTGQRFGRLSVESESGRDRFRQVSWRCKCDCGKHVIVLSGNLRRCLTRSCGCLNREKGGVNKKNLIGHRFGKLVVKADIGRDQNSRVLWQCQCDCGRLKKATTSKLVSGSIRSCGCINIERLIRIGKNKKIWVSKAHKNNSPTKGTSLYFKRIPACDNPSIIDGIVHVECKMCGKTFSPTYQQIGTRIASFSGKGHGENNFYCSDECKSACPTFNYKTNHTDPRLRKPKSEKAKARSCQTKTLKQIQCDHSQGQSYCEKCGDFIDVELHHTLPVAEFGEEAVNPAGHILLCAGCHVELHRVCA